MPTRSSSVRTLVVEEFGDEEVGVAAAEVDEATMLVLPSSSGSESPARMGKVQRRCGRCWWRKC